MAKRKTPTIVDVAARAGVSSMTVTRALTKDGPIAPKTKETVLAAVRDLGYRPNLLARSLRGGPTRSIGLITNTLSGAWSYNERLAEIEGAAWKQGYKILVSTHQQDPQREEACVEGMLGYRVDGFIVAPSRRSRGGFLESLRRENIPVVTIDCHDHFSAPDVTIDREHGAYIEVKHLLDLGRRRLAFLMHGTSGSRPAQARIRGYRRACTEAGINFDDQPSVIVHKARTSFQFGLCSTRDLLDSSQKFDGLVGINDRVALGAMAALMQAGLKIPQDVAVVGFDDEPLAAGWIIPLTTIQQPHNVGKLAVDMLIQQLQDAKSGARHPHDKPVKTVIKPKLIIRDSTVPQPPPAQ